MLSNFKFSLFVPSICFALLPRQVILSSSLSFELCQLPWPPLLPYPPASLTRGTLTVLADVVGADAGDSIEKIIGIGLGFSPLDPSVSACLSVTYCKGANIFCYLCCCFIDSWLKLFVDCLFDQHEYLFCFGSFFVGSDLFFGSHLNLFLVPFLQCLSNGSLASGIVYFFHLIDHYIW